MTTVITGTGIRVYQAMAIRKGMEFYLTHKRRINTLYTPKNMVAVAGSITGKSYTTRQMMQAINDLTKWIDAQSGGMEQV